MDKRFGLKINAIIQSFNVHTGKITKTSKVHNIVTNAGLDEVIDNGLINIGFMAVGTDDTAELPTDTELGTEVKRQAVIYTDEGTGIREFLETFLFDSGESYSIKEAGLFNSAIASGSIMLNRFTFTGHDVDVDNGVTIRITMTLTAI